ncbi:MAG: aminotransferase, partial [Ilumatobacteraceae bacterium]|nr:aminotransferase [Ilumatobacteraceae bacterium]
MSADPFGLRSFDVDVARTRPGVKWQREPHMLASWVADMDFPVAPAITTRLRALVDRGVFGYLNWPDGLSPAAHAFAARMERRHGWELDVSRLHELADVVQGVRMAIGMLSLPGDGVALHLPAYHPFLHT